jgi:glycosyltransferase involved in cell wall biosynthesis
MSMTPLSDQVTVAVFSYNRGAYLQHCLASIHRNMPFAVVRVYDDRSDDVETCAILAELEVEVIQPSAVVKAQHGGLYANMQRALDHAETDYLIIMQDDMQIVRPVDSTDLAAIAAIYADDPDCALVSPMFMKGAYAKKVLEQYVPAPQPRSYHTNPSIPKEAMRYAFSDVCLIHVGRSRSAGFRIVEGEGHNEVQAKALFSRMPLMADPFAFYCPEVPTFRNRRRPLSGRLARRFYKPKGIGFVDMTQVETAAFRSRSLDHWPFAEDYLRPENPNARRPFVFQDFQSTLALRILSRLEYWVLSGRRKIKRWRARHGNP